MAVYEFLCPKGHVSELMVRPENRPSKIKCKHEGCDEQQAEFVVSATPTTFRAQDRKAFKRSGR